MWYSQIGDLPSLLLPVDFFLSYVSHCIGFARHYLIKVLSFWFQYSLWPKAGAVSSWFWKHDQSSFSQFYSSLVILYSFGSSSPISSVFCFSVHKSPPLSLCLAVYIAHVSVMQPWGPDKSSSGFVAASLLFNQSPFYSHSLHIQCVEMDYFCN